ncbi:hypothetical protein NA57DRAFT_12216, partial [Rhizodiscina lignyota]
AQYEMVGDSALPSDPSVVMLTDHSGKPRWTVSIPPKYAFPLIPAQYKEICSQADEMTLHIADSKKQRKSHRYYGADPDFMDVPEAERKGLLGYAKGGSGAMDEVIGSLPQCKGTLTYVMETSDAGIGNSLLGLWMAYGLAQKEGRSFFVDDTRWPYGNYSSYFRPIPAANCAPPPPSHRVPCPHTAAHIVISAATFPHAFGMDFNNEFEDLRKTGVEQQRRIFALARTGYEALFHLADPDDVEYVKQRRSDVQETKEAGGMTIGLHVRRGDRHPWEYQYSKDYIPLTHYMDEARQVLLDRYEHDEEEEKAPSAGVVASKLLLATDDPDIYDAPDVARTERAQTRIVLASKKAIEKANPDAQPKNKYVDEIHGWEGGFFHDVFWGLGRDAPGASALASEPGDGVMQMRRWIGNGYVLDLAVLAEADVVVCGVSAMGCRLLAVMMGWERAFAQEGWRNVDGGFEWRGL